MAGRPTNEPSNYIALGKQASKDSEASTFYFFKHLDGSGFEVESQTEAVREGGDGQEVGFVHKTAINADGAIVANARPEAAGRLLAAVLGADSVAAASGNASGIAQVHTIVPTSQLPYLTVEQRWADVVERVGNAQVTELSIEGEAGRAIRLTANFMGGGTPYSRPLASALTPTREAGQPFFYPGASVVLDATAAKMTKWKTTIRRNLDGDIRTTSLHREDVVGLNFDTDFEGTLKYESRELYERAQAYASGGGPIDPNALGLATTAFSIYTEYGGGTAMRFFQVDQPLITITGARVNKLDPDGKTMYLDITGMGVRGATHQVIGRVQTASGGAF